jgi:hypothetical protein
MPIFDYADFVWGNKNNSVLMNHVQVLQNKAPKIILDAHPLSSASESLRSLNWQPLTIRRHFHRCLIMHKCLNYDVDFKFNFKFSSDIHSYNTRNKQNIHLERVKVCLWKSGIYVKLKLLKVCLWKSGIYVKLKLLKLN